MACITCKHYVPSTTRSVVERGKGFLSFGSETVPSYCSRGFDQTFADWWRVNGMKPGNEARLDVRECREEPESMAILSDMLTLIDRINNLL